MEEWSQYSNLILDKLDRHDKYFEKVTNQVSDLRIELAVQKKESSRTSAFIATITGAVSAIAVALILNYVMSKHEVVIYKEDQRKKEIIRQED